ncbi:ABC transporter permease [Heliophilum fasciatum]|uniref:Putative hemin transport system permease protein HrtB n=1 Tax=Heliophilum fasciatum TaxID=35700 RepID=A0A4R2RGH6_9FIRM|nr:FtsX-like permease family protein [Heliophilum fasciatum]MCW2278910.1 putative ABC transport system permease protein [Heliophilum fasciatum]TCP62043.1 putative ABC transport system permease protein [Heliophilum fasciatum]
MSIEQTQLCRLYHIAWRNLQRNRLRAGLLALSVALTTAILFGAYYFIHSIERSLDAGAGRMGADLIVTPVGLESSVENLLLSGIPAQVRMPKENSEKVAVVNGVEKVSPQLYMQTFIGECCNVYGEFPVIAIDPEADFTIRPFLLNDRPLERKEVAIGADIGAWDAWGMAYLPTWSESVRLLGTNFRVKNLLHRTNLGVDKTIFMHIDDARAIAARDDRHSVKPGDISVVMVKVKPGSAYEDVARDIEAAVPGVKVFTGNKLSRFVEAQLKPIKILLYAITGFVLLMASLQVMSIFSAIVHERRREIGYLRAMGATKGKVFQLFLWEGFWASLIGGGVGLFIALILLVDMRNVIQDLIPLPLLFPWFGDGVIVSFCTMVVAIMITLLSAVWPISRSMNLDPYEAVREGE